MDFSKQINSVRAAWKTILQSRQSIREVNKMLFSVDRMYVCGKWISAFFNGLMSIGTFALFGVVIQKFITEYGTKEKISIELLITGIILVGAFQFSKMLLDAVMSWREANFEDKLDFLLESQQIEKLHSLDLGRLTDPDFIALKDNAESRGDRAIGSLFRTQMSTLSAVVGVIVSMSIIAFIDGWVLFFALLPVIPQTIKALVIEQRRRQLWEKNHMDRRRKNEYGWCITDKTMLVQAKLFRFVDYMRGRHIFFLRKMRDAELHLQRFDFKTDLLVNALTLLVLLTILFYLGRGIVDGSITLTKLFFLVGSIMTFIRSLQSLSRIMTQLGTGTKDYGYRKEFHEVKPLIDETDAKEIFFQEPPVLKVNDVTFSYPRQNGQEALKKCSFVIRPREKVAIVGRNGSGKTTAVRLLAKIFLPSDGEVRIGEYSTQTITQQSLHEHILYVTQDSVVPDLPISEATTGAALAEVDQTRLEQAASLCGADSFIKKLVEGYLTQIGEEWPGGVGFSSGQLQRLKITAALYRILGKTIHVGLFDEPMSNCDIETREYFYSSLRGLTEKTIVVIAHDPSYLHHFDRVIVMENGTVINDFNDRDAIEKYQSSVVRTHSNVE